MSDGTAAHKLAQDLDAAIAAYQRTHGRPATIARLRHMLERAETAQRFMDDAMARMGSTNPRAPE